MGSRAADLAQKPRPEDVVDVGIKAALGAGAKYGSNRDANRGLPSDIRGQL